MIFLHTQTDTEETYVCYVQNVSKPALGAIFEALYPDELGDIHNFKIQGSDLFAFFQYGAKGAKVYPANGDLHQVETE